MYNEITVLESNAGYYVGRTYTDEEFGFEKPGTRESGYYPTQEAAIHAVCEGFTLRSCEENIAAYASGVIDTTPGSFYQDKEFWKEFLNVPGFDPSPFN